MRRYQVPVTTAADGSATALSVVMVGRIYAIHYVKHATTPFADGVDFTITSNALGENLWTEANVNASTVRRPRVFTHAPDGTEITDENREPIAIASDRVKFVIANGGNVKVGTFHVLIE